ncbi:hypothetical protein C0J52_20446 [Blattella germanica]|nr:hypothetical protein C0J52_20446 [Blattella germanica]
MCNLRESQRGMIVGARLVGASAATVANVVGVSKGTVSNVMRIYSMHQCQLANEVCKINQWSKDNSVR